MSTSSTVKFISDAELEASLPAVFFDRLKAIAERQGISVEAALAQAIRVDEMVLDTKRDHGEVLLVKDGKQLWPRSPRCSSRLSRSG